MKKILFLSFFVISAITVHAQETKKEQPINPLLAKVQACPGWAALVPIAPAPANGTMMQGYGALVFEQPESGFVTIYVKDPQGFPLEISAGLNDNLMRQFNLSNGYKRVNICYMAVGPNQLRFWVL